MPAKIPVQTPAGFAPAFALGFADEDGDLLMASNASPVPVAFGDRSRPPALEGSTSTSALVGPYAPVPSLSVMLELGGSWSGTVQLQRSGDGGATLRDVTLGGAVWGNYAANACEPVWDESEPGALLYLSITLDSGTLDYRVSQ